MYCNADVVKQFKEKVTMKIASFSCYCLENRAMDLHYKLSRAK